MTKEANNPLRIITFRENLNVWIQPNRKQGRPLLKWTDEALKELWNTVRTEHPAQYRTPLYSNKYNKIISTEVTEILMTNAQNNP